MDGNDGRRLCTRVLHRSYDPSFRCVRAVAHHHSPSKLFNVRFVDRANCLPSFLQVSVVSLPHELQPRLYQYGVATPFFRVSNAVRTIIFNTKNEIGLDIGILLAWALLSVCTVTLLTTVFRRRELKKERMEEEKAAVSKA